jgi:hypothetical protein
LHLSRDSVFTGAAFWPVSEAAFLLEAWEEWAKTAPRAASTAFRVMSFPPLPGIPPQLTEGPVVCIDGAVLDDEGRTGAEIAAGLLEPLRRRAMPIFDTWHPGIPTTLLRPAWFRPHRCRAGRTTRCHPRQPPKRCCPSPNRRGSALYR